MESSENSFETPKPLFPQLGTKKIIRIFFFRKMSPKNAKGVLLTYIQLQNTKKLEPFETIKNFRKKSHSAEKNRKGGPYRLVRFCGLR